MRKLICLVFICILFSSCFKVRNYYYRYEIEVTFQNGEQDYLEYGGKISLVTDNKVLNSNPPIFFINNGDLCFETEDNRQVLASGVRSFSLVRKIRVEIK